MSDICPACNTTMTTVPSEHDGATGYYVCPHCNGYCEHGRRRMKCETCAAWESSLHNQQRAEGAELQLSQTQAMLDRAVEGLEWYSDATKYYTTHNPEPQATLDHGDIAKQILADIKAMKEDTGDE